MDKTEKVTKNKPEIRHTFYTYTPSNHLFVCSVHVYGIGQNIKSLDITTISSTAKQLSKFWAHVQLQNVENLQLGDAC